MEGLVKSIIFDLDGTLVDTLPDINAACQEMLFKLNLEPIPILQVRSFIGNGVKRLVERCLEVRGQEASEYAHEAFRESYEKAPSSLSKLYPGVKVVLGKLVLDGFVLGICTNKPSYLTSAIVMDLEIKSYFKSIICGDSLIHMKPNPIPLVKTIRELGSSVGKAIFVGDSETDIKTAHAAGVRFGLFTEGYRNSSLEEMRFDFCFQRFSTLNKKVYTFF
ncbi:MAG: phosphoglycolate phosphatase [Paracoccaceae bacterium]|jgi:phosphoglycolate phosphatase